MTIFKKEKKTKKQSLSEVSHEGLITVSSQRVKFIFHTEEKMCLIHLVSRDLNFKWGTGSVGHLETDKCCNAPAGRPASSFSTSLSLNSWFTYYWFMKACMKQTLVTLRNELFWSHLVKTVPNISALVVNMNKHTVKCVYFEFHFMLFLVYSPSTKSNTSSETALLVPSGDLYLH